MQSVLRSLQVFEAVARRQPVRVGELVPELGLSKSTVQRALRTLQSAGWLAAAAGDLTRWVVSPRVRGLLGSHDQVGLREAALPAMRALRDATGEGVHLSVPVDGHRMVIIDRLDSAHELQIIAALGTAFRAVTVAGGLAALSRSPREALDAAIMAARDDDGGGDAVVGLDAVPEIVAAARDRGWVAHPSPSGLSMGVAAPLMGPADEPVAAIALVVPVMRVEPARLPRLGVAVREAADAASARLAR
jgi:IclR family acetate operon transcriptional repressor